MSDENDLNLSDPQLLDVRPMRPPGAEFKASFIQRAGAQISALFAGEKIAVLDLSKWNTVVDWQAVYDGGVRCVILRATFGLSGVDTKFIEYCQAAHAVGLLVMTYHYTDSSQSGAAQAEHHWNTIQPMLTILGYAPVVWNDIEDLNANVTNPQRLNRGLSFLQTIEVKQGSPEKKRCGIYSSPGYANSYLSPAPSWINVYLQWVAHWTSAAMPQAPAGWKTVPEFWQYGFWDNYPWCAPVAGCLPDIDRDWYFGSLDELVLLATGTITIPPVDPPPDPPPDPGEPLENPPAAVCWAIVTNDKGVIVRKGPAANQGSVGSLAKGTVIPVFEREDKTNGEVWVHTHVPGSQIVGWAAQFYTPYGDDAKLMDFVLPPESS